MCALPQGDSASVRNKTHAWKGARNGRRQTRGPAALENGHGPDEQSRGADGPRRAQNRVRTISLRCRCSQQSHWANTRRKDSRDAPRFRLRCPPHRPLRPDTRRTLLDCAFSRALRTLPSPRAPSFHHVVLFRKRLRGQLAHPACPQVWPCRRLAFLAARAVSTPLALFLYLCVRLDNLSDTENADLTPRSKGNGAEYGHPWRDP